VGLSNNTVPTSRPYRVSLTITIVLLLLTVTAMIVLIIINNAQEDDREAALNLTITAVVDQMHITQTALIATPTSAPQVVLGQYLFALVADSPTYSAASDCNAQYLIGRILTENETPTDAYTVFVWGDYLPEQTVLTGEPSGQPEGQWRLELPDMLHRRVWVQLWAGDRYVSPPIEVIFNETDCTRNQAEIVLKRVGR